MTDKQIIENLITGGLIRERTASFLVDSYISYTFKIQNKLGLTKDEALAVYTDTIVDFIDQIIQGVFKGNSKLSTYFYQILYYKSVDQNRKKTTNHKNVLELEENTHNSLESNADYKMEVQEDFDKIQHHLSILGQPCKSIILDWGYWGFTMQEIAVKNNLESAKQAKDRKYKCLQKLKKLIKD